MSDKELEIMEVIERIRPYINRDGGDIEYVGYEDGIVYVRLGGACVGCGAIEYTINDGLESMLMEEIEGIEAVYVVE